MSVCGGQLFKYGVVSLDDLCDDLTEWTSLYVSGRMHKPVSARVSRGLQWRPQG